MHFVSLVFEATGHRKVTYCRFKNSTRSFVSKGVFTAVLFSLAESNSVPFSPLVRFVWVGVNTVIKVQTKTTELSEEVVSALLQTPVGFICGMNVT